MPKLQFNLVAPVGTVFSGEVAEVQLPTAAGAITLLHDHMPLVSSVATGVVVIHGDGDSIDHYAVGPGVLTVTKQDATLTTEAVEHADSIEEIETRRELEEAQSKLATELTDEEVAYTEGVIERNLARVEASNLHKNYRARH